MITLFKTAVSNYEFIFNFDFEIHKFSSQVKCNMININKIDKM